MSYSHPIASLPVHNSHHVNFKFHPEAATAITEEKISTHRNKNNGPSPHQLDELAATATIFLNQSNNNNSRSIMHKVQLDEKKDGGSSTDNVQMPEDSSSSVHVPSLSNSTNTSTAQPETATVEPTVKTTTQRQRAPTITSTDGYHDYAQEEDPTEKLNRDYAGHSSLIAHEDETTRSLANQKLPAKLAAMLSDPDLISCITWLPHGRSWKILNRDLFSSYALPRYFGHTNHSSFVRVVNAWGFRRIVSGPDRDSYYHELFLRGKVGLYSRMKRLPNNSGGSSGRKRGKEGSPQLKGVEEKPLDFYEMSKQSPLPENTWQYRPQAMNNGGVGSRSSLGAAAAAFGGAGMPGGMQMGGMMPSSMVPPPPGAGMVGMGMHHPSQFSTGGGAVGYPTMASTAAPMPMMSAAATTAPMPMMASSGWNVPTQMQVGGASSASTSATAAAGMMGMSRHRQPSISMPFDGSSSASSSGVAGARGGPPADNNSSSIGSSTNRPQLLASAAAAVQRPNESSSSAMTASTGAPTSISSSSSEIQSLMNQNQLLQALLRKTQAAVAAANVGPGGGAAAGGSGGGYPYPYSGPPAYGHGGNDEMKRQG